MSEPGAARTRWRRGVCAAALVYVFVLVLAGLARPLRPAWLDGPSDAAFRALDRVGIRPGLDVFRSRSSMKHLFRTHDCLQVSATPADGAPRQIFDSCPAPGMRWRWPPEARMFSKWLVGLDAVEAAPVLRERELAAAVHYFCRHGKGAPFRRVELARLTGDVLYDSGARSEQRATLIEADCD